jgi:hypothetical protein
MTQRQKILAQIEKMEPVLRKAFLVSVSDIRSAAKLSTVIGHLESGNIEAAIMALNIRPEFFAPLDDALRLAYMEGGRAALAAVPGIASGGGFPQPSGSTDGTHGRSGGWSRTAAG